MFLAYGDSKSTAPAYEPELAASLTTETGYVVSSDTIAVGGATVASMQARVDSDLSAKPVRDGMRWVLINLGANDAANLDLGPADQAAWEANLGYIFDALHVKYPNATVYAMRPWTRNDPGDCDEIAPWIANVVAARAPWAALGPDERVFLENGDNGVTYTVDGIHPNVVGYTLTAAQWLAALGY